MLSVSEGGRRLARLGLPSDRKIVQYSASETLTLDAGRHVLLFTFTPEDGRVLRQNLTVDVPASGSVRVVADVGTLGRNLQVKVRP